MILLRRVVDASLLWLPVVAAVVICWAVTAWSPGSRPRPETTIPAAPLRPGEWRGPSVDEVIERLGRESPRPAGQASPVE